MQMVANLADRVHMLTTMGKRIRAAQQSRISHLFRGRSRRSMYGRGAEFADIVPYFNLVPEPMSTMGRSTPASGPSRSG
jgi:hypothetical protein